MKDVVFVQFVTDLQVISKMIEGSRFILLHARGFSTGERPGIPSLVRQPGSKDIIPQMEEFDFIIHAIGGTEKEQHLEWEVNTVLMLDDSNRDLKAVKVKAGENADIAVIDTH